MGLFTFNMSNVEDHSDELDAISIPESAEFIICKSPGKLKILVDRIEEGKDLHYISSGDWSMHDLLAAVLNRFAPAKLYLSTYALREYSVRQLILGLDSGKLTEVNMLVDYRAQIRVPEVYQLAAHNATTIRLLSIHAKVMVLTGNGLSLTLVGSANWTNNPRVEAGVISLNKSAANFHINWMKKLIEHAEIFK